MFSFQFAPSFVLLPDTCADDPKWTSKLNRVMETEKKCFNAFYKLKPEPAIYFTKFHFSCKMQQQIYGDLRHIFVSHFYIQIFLFENQIQLQMSRLTIDIVFDRQIVILFLTFKK